QNLGEWFVRGSNGTMTPFSSFATISWATAPTTVSRFQGILSFEFQGQPAPGKSSGDAMKRMEELAAQIPGTSIAWAGLSY
ncbi:efflux RND transporter permease subunit, partial [Stenotrophomonas maltophilia]|uniref:efflux RND transporter permease subunit n=1 Tax=Stenotrophomonas maltophilia TaxID=40324 RepID=UPI0013DB0E3D